MRTASVSLWMGILAIITMDLPCQHPAPDLSTLWDSCGYDRALEGGGSIAGTLRLADRDGSGATKLHWREFLPGDPQVAYSIPGMNRITGVQWLWPDRVLVAGAMEQQGSGVGKIAELKLDYATHTIQWISGQDLGAVIPASLVYNQAESIAYILDAVTGAVLAALWSGSPATLPSVFVPVATNVEELPVRRIIAIDDAGGVRTARRQLFESKSLTAPIPPRLKRVWFDGAGWQCEFVGPSTVPASAPCWVIERTSPLHTAPFLVSLSDVTATGAFELRVRSTGQVLASGVISAPGHKLTIPAPAEFETNPGIICHVVDAVPAASGNLPSNDLIQVARYGKAFSVGGTSLKSYRAILSPTDAVVGNRDFGFACRFDVAEVARSPASILAGVLIGVRGVDDVTVVGDFAVLTPAFSVILPQAVEGEHLDFGARIPIPSDPQLDGVVVLGQVAAVAADGSLAFSDVVGTKICSPFSGVALRSIQSGVPGERGPSPSEQRASAQRIWADNNRGREDQPGRGLGWAQRALHLLRERR